ncbi:hypothetical protein Pelo_4578 [Pelomyxa schiedti]|nr:hypothetical protein Pelo_4578 [Pelomyxa schiedti]
MNCGCDVERWEKNLEKLIDTLFSWIRVVKKQILLVQEAELLHRGYCSGKSAAYPPISRIELRSNPHKLATLRKAILSTQLRVIEVLSEAWKQLSVVPGSDTLLSHLRTCRICKGDLSVVDDSQNTVESSLWILQQKQRLCSRLCSHFSSISACYITSLNCRLSKESNCACTELNTLIGQVVSVVEEETHFLTTPTSINPPTPPFTPGKTLNLNNSFGENCDQLRCKLPSLESRLLLCKEMVLQYSEQYTDVPNNAPLQKPTLSEINDCFASVSTTFAYFLEKWRDMSTTWLSENENSPQSPSTHNNTEQPPHQQANTEPPTQTQNLEVGSQTPPPHNSDSTFTATSTTATSTVVLESVTSDTEEDSGNESPEKQRERRQQRAEIARQRRLMMQEQQQRAEELHTLMSELSAVLQVRKKETLS